LQFVSAREPDKMRCMVKEISKVRQLSSANNHRLASAETYVDKEQLNITLRQPQAV
jgi:hypothetical protein